MLNHYIFLNFSFCSKVINTSSKIQQLLKLYIILKAEGVGGQWAGELRNTQIYQIVRSPSLVGKCGGGEGLKRNPHKQTAIYKSNSRHA